MTKEVTLSELAEKVDHLVKLLESFQMPAQMLDEKPIINVADAAKLIGVSAPVIYELIGKDPSFPAKRVGERRTVISKRKLLEWVEMREEKKSH